MEINRKNSEKYRKAHCSNIYQDYMLIEDMTVGENIELALQAAILSLNSLHISLTFNIDFPSLISIVAI